ncbi:tyrosine-type recombinase/integrase [candidate division WOR-3 bacterium]|nr:tyrosine-type recombinase/integrase [candidate division WOR-3 bacterium]
MTPRQRKLPEFLTEEEQKVLLKQPNHRYPTGQRNHLMMKLMLDIGLRLSEATNLKWKHIDLMSGKLMVRDGKGEKDRTLWIGEKDIELLEKWRERQLEKTDRDPEYVFTTLKGTPVKNRYVQFMVKRYSEKAGITKNISPHTLRHTFATDLYRETKNIRIVQKALGHSDLSTTMIYTHIVDDELEEAMKNFRNKSDDT